MASSRSSKPKRKALAAKKPIRPRDLLHVTSFPVHPFDQAHGVDTSGLVPAKHLTTGHAHDEHVTAYYGVAPSILRALIAHWRETVPPHPISSYTFLDIGCGKGRALLVASELPFRRVVGIELNPKLAAIARANAEAWTRSHAADPTAPLLAPIDVLEQDALELALPATPTLIFLFHPFEAPLLRKLLRRIETQIAEHASLAAHNGPSASTLALDVLYVNAECANVLDRHPAFQRLFIGQVPMTPEDHAADLEAIAQQKEYGSTGDEECAIYRYVGRSKNEPRITRMDTDQNNPC
ncbi:MAG TPA: class I SAM-dependent methyltransferase [Acidobacteriaceae bacterium]|nr:class I SAM-dependent methyltransferase [Acidobacteriaceae bacterium]